MNRPSASLLRFGYLPRLPDAARFLPRFCLLPVGAGFSLLFRYAVAGRRPPAASRRNADRRMDSHALTHFASQAPSASSGLRYIHNGAAQLLYAIMAFTRSAAVAGHACFVPGNQRPGAVERRIQGELRVGPLARNPGHASPPAAWCPSCPEPLHPIRGYW
ncbi:hypothetical protein DL89DRAFT_103176 [Linderina pennispora]|uniref:Uncharacterized protein n=1 Tax=Linderina pennispora TaxID=61395 RepID=A0A1Y1WED6_9FUNG|nr:uncharacterized protein DL89DRAFT_103176 [Linderina pennispora]ORX71890.1 hypothetical protein DL89DRAFT_103176 [Linderina pennispora]